MWVQTWRIQGDLWVEVSCQNIFHWGNIAQTLALHFLRIEHGAAVRCARRQLNPPVILSGRSNVPRKSSWAPSLVLLQHQSHGLCKLQSVGWAKLGVIFLFKMPAFSFFRWFWEGCSGILYGDCFKMRKEQLAVVLPHWRESYWRILTDSPIRAWIKNTFFLMLKHSILNRNAVYHNEILTLEALINCGELITWSVKLQLVDRIKWSMSVIIRPRTRF